MAGIGGHTLPVKGATDSWITPKWIIDVLGPFDLDPCASDPQPWACAKRSLTIREDGLSRAWGGRVWLNPPYSRAGEFLGRMRESGLSGVALLFARTETRSFVENVWGCATGIVFFHGRLHFCKPDGSRAVGNAGGPSCLVSYGIADGHRLHRAVDDGLIRGTFCTIWR